ncbi:MAG TPA: glutamyl-tRNA reductase [Mycobacteriales bacterium]|nr:glutamyl-tRNA reductase [Mycobacteriales bacterium]
MSVLVVGLSHRSAPVELLERVAIPADHIPKALHELQHGTSVAEAAILSTCNRVEVYAHVARFHGGVQEVTDLLSRLSGVPIDELSDHLYVHYEERAVQHLFTVASGLDSMVVGEGQILGQVRAAFRVAQEEGSVARVLGELFRHSLRVGKRVRTETAIGRAGASLVGIGLRVATASLGPLGPHTNAVVVGAGSMGALAGATLRREGVERITVANRTAERAAALAATLEGRGIALEDLPAALAEADLVVSSTGAAGTVLDAETLRAARGGSDRPLFLLDLALPRDVDPAVRELPGVRLADLDALRAVLDTEETGADLDECRRIVADEVAVFLGWQRAMRVAPTVVALRAKADAVITAELERLAARVPGMDGRSRGEVESAVRRVVEKLLHAPTVRVKELAEAPGGDHYAEALRELFGLDPQVPEAVAAPEETP